MNNSEKKRIPISYLFVVFYFTCLFFMNVIEKYKAHMRSKSMVCVQFAIQTGPAWEPRLKLHSKRPVHSGGTYTGWDRIDFSGILFLLL